MNGQSKGNCYNWAQPTLGHLPTGYDYDTASFVSHGLIISQQGYYMYNT